MISHGQDRREELVTPSGTCEEQVMPLSTRYCHKIHPMTPSLQLFKRAARLRNHTTPSCYMAES